MFVIERGNLFQNEQDKGTKEYCNRKALQKADKNNDELLEKRKLSGSLGQKN